LESHRSKILSAATIIVAAFVVSRLLGVVREMVITAYFGIDSVAAEAYAIAIRFPDTIFYILAGGALGSAFIPIFTGYFAREDEAGAWRFFSAISNLVVAATTAVCLITAIFAPRIITAFVPNLVLADPELLDLTVQMTRVMLLSPIIFGASGVVMAALNARQHFLLPALGPIIYNLGIIGGVVLGAPNAVGLAVGTVVGALGHLAIQLPALRWHEAAYSPILTLRDASVRQALRLMGPRILGLSFSQLNHLVIPPIAQLMAPGSIRALDLGWRLMILPHGILGQALGIAAFPTFAALAAQKNLAEMRRILADSLRLVFFLGLPLTLLMMILRQPVARFLFMRGDCDAACADFIGWALLFFAPGMVALTGIELISRAFYALEDTKTPVLAGFLQLVMLVVLAQWLSYTIFPRLGWLELGGLALASSLSNLFEAVLLIWLLRRKLGGVDGRHLLDGFWRMSMAGLLTLAAIGPLYGALAGLSSLWQWAAVPAVAAAIYPLAAHFLRVAEMGVMTRLIGKTAARLKR
jgi:putative peptidoglycan lipid II flippase